MNLKCVINSGFNYKPPAYKRSENNLYIAKSYSCPSFSKIPARSSIITFANKEDRGFKFRLSLTKGQREFVKPKNINKPFRFYFYKTTEMLSWKNIGAKDGPLSDAQIDILYKHIKPVILALEKYIKDCGCQMPDCQILQIWFDSEETFFTAVAGFNVDNEIYNSTEMRFKIYLDPSVRDTGLFHISIWDINEGLSTLDTEHVEYEAFIDTVQGANIGVVLSRRNTKSTGKQKANKRNVVAQADSDSDEDLEEHVSDDDEQTEQTEQTEQSVTSRRRTSRRGQKASSTKTPEAEEKSSSSAEPPSGKEGE